MRDWNEIERLVRERCDSLFRNMLFSYVEQKNIQHIQVITFPLNKNLIYSIHTFKDVQNMNNQIISEKIINKVLQV